MRLASLHRRRAVAVLGLAAAIGGCGASESTPEAAVQVLRASSPGVGEVQRAAQRRLEAQEPLLGASARTTFCAIEFAAADGSLTDASGRATQVWGWATCQQIRPQGRRGLAGGTQSSEPVRAVIVRDAGRLTVDALEAPQQGLDYEASMRALFPVAARRVVDQLPAGAFDARIDRLLCANLAAAGRRFDRPGATLAGQGERCD